MTDSQVFNLKIRTDNAAFEGENLYPELARILRQVADKVEAGGDACRWFQTVRDVNGNDVGRYALKEETER